jgi:hypothetical protein
MVPARPASAAAAYRLGAPTESDLVTLRTKTAGQDAAAVVRQARAAAQVAPGPLSLDALEKVTRAVVAAGQFPTTVSARSFRIRLGSFRSPSQRTAPASTTLHPAGV